MMTDEATTAPENTTPENETTTPENQETQEPADIQASVENAHQAAAAHFSQQPSIAPTYKELRADADRAAGIIQDLHTTIATSTPQGSTSETMQTDRQKATQAQEDIKNGTDPLAAYAGYSAYAVPQPEPDGKFRNYYENPLTYDEYSVSEDKKGLNVEYNLTELTPGSVARAVTDPNIVTGTGIEEKSFSYNEKKSGSNTIVTTEHTLKGTHTPGSYNINDGQTEADGFVNTRTGTYVYDKNERLTEQTMHSEANDIISDSRSVAHNKQDMSQGETKGYCRTFTDITASRNAYTRFSHTEYAKDGTETEGLSGELRKSSESYIHQEEGTVTEACHRLNDKGVWVYEGGSGKFNGETMTNYAPFSPEKAEKEFKRLRKSANKHIKILTGAHDMAEYTQQLGAPRQSANLSAIWNGRATPEDRIKAEQANAAVAETYANTPAAIVALKTTNRR